MLYNLEEIVTKMEELESEETETEIDTSSVTGSKCSSRTSDAEESDTATSEYAALYKATKTPANQESRRKKLLEAMKLRRNQAVNQKRGLFELLGDESSDLEYEQSTLEEPMDITSRHKPRRRRRKNIYTNQLMLSEWFTEIPLDLESQWLVKLCPVGVRNLVVAHYGITRAFSKSGKLLSTFQSELPGGNEHLSNTRMFTVLDCIYNSKLKSYFILDVIAWRNCTVQLSDAEFRFFWLKSRLDETPALKELSPLNEHSFYEIASFPAELPLIQSQLSQPYTINEQVIPLDGVLFYHRAAHYIASHTPLVGWLKPFMVPEMLCIPVDEYFMKKMPKNYGSIKQYLLTSSRNVKNKKQEHSCDNETLVEVEMEV